MERVIYYPGFEVRDENWLKFALLYIDQLHPIIPEAGDPYLSETHRRLVEETDLIAPHRPDYAEGQLATLDAIDIVKKIIENPSYYSREFSNTDPSSLWRNPDNWRYTLFEEKYTPAWNDFCHEYNLGKQGDKGLMVERSLALLYMSILAHAISEARDAPAITDYGEMNQISLATRRTNRESQGSISVAKGIIQLQLPANLSEISLNSIVKFRQQTGFKERLHAFHCELGAWMKEVEDGTATADFFRTRGGTFAEFSDEIARLGIGVASLALNIWLLLAEPASTATQLLTLSQTTGLTVGSVISLRNTWKNTQTKRFTRKYLADIEHLG